MDASYSETESEKPPLPHLVTSIYFIPQTYTSTISSPKQRNTSTSSSCPQPLRPSHSLVSFIITLPLTYHDSTFSNFPPSFPPPPPNCAHQILFSQQLPPPLPLHRTPHAKTVPPLKVILVSYHLLSLPPTNQQKLESGFQSSSNLFATSPVPIPLLVYLVYTSPMPCNFRQFRENL